MTRRRTPATPPSAPLRYPAEWEPQARVWLTRPHNVETWPGCLEKAQAEFDRMAAAIQAATPVAMTHELGIPTDDSWVRDYGPLFVKDAAGRLYCHDFRFNAWGDKYEPYDADDAAAARIAAYLQLPVIRHDEVLEGGAIDVNGAGSVMTTEQCLLNPNRNPRKSRSDIERMLHEGLGTHHVIWLPGGIAGDDTDGHIDTIARFVNPTTVVAPRAPRDHLDHEGLERNWRVLQHARDQDGKQLTLVELPAAPSRFFDYPADRFGPGGSKPLPASYTNFLISNQHVFVPVYEQPTDAPALRIYEQVMPGFKIVPVSCRWLVVGYGAVHCLSMQQPA